MKVVRRESATFLLKQERMDKKIDQPTSADERELNSLIKNKPTVVHIPGTRRKYKIKWIKHETERKITDILVETKEGDDNKISCKVAAAIVQNDFWKIRFFHWILWRWFYYVRQYGDAQLLPLIREGKKKVQQEEFYEFTMSAIGMRDTIMTMKKEEIERFLREPRGEQPTSPGRNTPG